MKIKFDEKDPYYSELPSIFKIATLDDFFLNEDIILKKPYLIHSMVNENRYWACRTKPGFMNHNDFHHFLEYNRIFVLKK